MGCELETTEKPFVAQLQALGWQHIEGSIDDPSVTGRTGFAEVIQESLLREQLRALNPGPDGLPWLDEARLQEAVAAITRLGTHKLMEANEKATALLIRGLTVEGLPGWDGGRGQTIRYIDWDTPANNRFTVINQYRVDCPPGFNSAKQFIVPDLVLLVNGIPLVVVECKSPSIPEPLAEAVDQLRRYSNQRKAAFEVDENEGNEPLFATNQLLVATSFDEARVGCIGAAFEHYAQWKTVVGPDGTGSELEVAHGLGKSALSEQERLIAGLLTPAHLLDVVQNFMLFMQAGGQTIKTVCRYQQYRAVNRALVRLKTGLTRRQHGEHDQRGGIIWHTQGSGKSLTMVFLVRKMRADAQLRRFKVIVITDRKDLQSQLSVTATLTGEVVDVAESTSGIKTLARRKGPGLIFATIQKYRDSDIAGDAPLTADDLPKVEQTKAGYKAEEKFEVLNEDDSILVLVDEAHRTQAGDLHANLLAGLPNCARIGFTGTPIIMGEKKRTHEIFGEFIDRYTIKEAEADGATVPVLYEGRTANGAIKDGASLDELFEDLFRQHTPEELEAIKQKYATKSHIFDAPTLIADKARDIIRHYVTNILPNGYKAQVVAYSRLAAIRYFEALQQARDELLAEAQALSPEDKALDDEALCQRPAKVQAVVQAWRYRDTLARIEFAPVISGSNNDDPAWKRWTDGTAHEQLLKRFKKPLLLSDGKGAKPEKTDPLAFLVVKSMLLTGFDAPIEGVMYLDRPIREAELLQAIARVNRTGFGKRCGIVVDYYGVAQHLKEALAAYADEDVAGALASLKDEVPVLRDRHLRVVDLFRRHGIESLDDAEACVEALGSEKLRAEFAVKLKAFLASLDTVLPRPEGLPYSGDAKRLAYIYARARNRYKDTPVLGKDIGAKVRKLIDDHVISLGIDPKIPPIQLSDAEFDSHVARAANDRAKASEMEHAIRSHISKHTDEDPVLYRKLSERLNDILKNLGEQWNEVIAQLQKIIDELRTGRAGTADAPSDLPEHCAPFLRTVLDVVSAGQTPTATELLRLKDVTVELVDLLVQELQSNRDIWSPHKRAAQEDLNTQLFEHLMRLRPPLVDTDKAGVLADKLMEQARANHDKLVQV
ncbi:type I restriction endonuclease subunit R [Methylomonas sp. DH-1]|uniref:type I restriction endonuclease subunit R n=1 Tax=Methylomonas sp. (strain DH-1) TaxID=1727196 RepID=UPI0007C8AFB7|nr:type I restriction endonuclease subunit R [Methylomonas sp. DH-1]ANE53736.1 restriction endonuclease subunit R [Methylomonas sp. DH-1]